MKLVNLNLNNCGQIKDLTPLQGMPLTSLNLSGCGQIKDLASLHGMKLTGLELQRCVQVEDLSPLKGMPLTRLNLIRCDKLKDVSPLQGMNLADIQIEVRLITQGMDALRSMKSLNRINGLPPAEFWKNYDAGEYKELTARIFRTLVISRILARNLL